MYKMKSCKSSCINIVTLACIRIDMLVLSIALLLKNGFAVTSTVLEVPHFVHVITVSFCLVTFTLTVIVVKFLVVCAAACVSDTITPASVLVPGLFVWIAIALFSDTIAATCSVIVQDSIDNVNLVAY